LSQFQQTLLDFKNSFTGTFMRKFAIKQSQSIPQHLNYVATLLCDLMVKHVRVARWFKVQ